MDRRGENQWLLIKDSDAPTESEFDVLTKFSNRVLSGRTLDQIAAAVDNQEKLTESPNGFVLTQSNFETPKRRS